MIQVIHRVFFAQLAFAGVLVMLHLIPQSASRTLDRFFDLNREGNVPTWYSSMLLFCVCLAAIAIHFSNIHLKTTNPTSTRALATPLWFWITFSCFYAFLSLDEATSIHELTRFWLRIRWFYLYALLGAFLFFAAAYSFHRAGNSARDLQFWILGGLMIYAFGGLVCDAIARIYHPLPTLLASIEVIVEEALELIGTTFVLRGCLGEVSRLWETQIPHQNAG